MDGCATDASLQVMDGALLTQSNCFLPMFLGFVFCLQDLFPSW